MAKTIAIASGKGGTGKTTFAVNLACVSNKPVVLLDCDVEAPNTHLFFSKQWDTEDEVYVNSPVIDEKLCVGCGECQKHCRFNALILLRDKPLVTYELCHSCGACVLACPSNIISEKPRAIGVKRTLQSGKLKLIQGELNIGEARSSALIDHLKRVTVEREIVFIDAPPGTSCATIAAISDVDYLVLVTEPTPLGFNDLKLAVEMAARLNLKVGVIINKSDIGKEPIKKYCRDKEISIIAEMGYDQSLAKAYSEGKLVLQALPEYQEKFNSILSCIYKEMSKCKK